MVYGLSIAIVVGIPLAVGMARFRWLDWALDLPINALLRDAAGGVVPLLVLWFGIYLKAKIIVVFLFAVFPVLINTYQGVRECDKNMIEVARSFRSSEWRMWQDVLLPFAVPYIAAGVRLAIGRGLVGMIIAEFYTTISGLGFMITRYANVFEMDKTFVPVIVLMILGVSLTSVLKWIERRSHRGARATTEAGRRPYCHCHEAKRHSRPVRLPAFGSVMSDPPISRGFRGRGRGGQSARIPPGQHLVTDFPGAFGRADAGSRPHHVEVLAR